MRAHTLLLSAFLGFGCALETPASEDPVGSGDDGKFDGVGSLTVPAETQFGSGCGRRIADVFASPLEELVEEEQARSGSEWATQESDLAVALFEEEFQAELDGDGVGTFHVTTRLYENAIQVTVDAEDHQVSYLFDEEGLILSQELNGYMWSHYYCRDADAETQSEPNDRCVNALLSHGAHRPSSLEPVAGTLKPTALEFRTSNGFRAQALLIMAGEAYLDGLDSAGLPVDVDVPVDGEMWGDGAGAHLTADGALGPIDYLVIDDGNRVWALLEEANDSEPSLRCKF